MKKRADVPKAAVVSAPVGAGKDGDRDSGEDACGGEPAVLSAYLASELARMAEQLRSLPMRGSLRDSGSLTAIVRLEPDLDREAWRSLVNSGRCEGWIALPLPTDLAQSLHGMQAQKSAPHPGLAETPAASAFGLRPDGSEERGLLPVPRFLERLNEEVERARGGHASLCLALMETRPSPCEQDQPGTGPDLPASFASPACESRALRVLGQCLRQAAHSGDIPGRFGTGLLALIMPDTGPFQALALVERVVSETCLSLNAPCAGAPSFPPEEASSVPYLVRAGVVEFPGGGDADTSAMVELARRALDRASPVFDAPVQERVYLHRPHASAPERETLVLASEKQFLFFGRV